MAKSDKGQSLYEVIFAIGIATVILTAVVALATTTIRNTTYSKNKAEANKLNQEATEWLREQKEKDWDNLADHLGNNKCLGDLSWTSGCSVSGTEFDRKISLTQDAEDIIAQVMVSWSDGSGEHQVKSVITFTNWKSI